MCSLQSGFTVKDGIFISTKMIFQGDPFAGKYL